MRLPPVGRGDFLVTELGPDEACRTFVSRKSVVSCCQEDEKFHVNPFLLGVLAGRTIFSLVLAGQDTNTWFTDWELVGRGPRVFDVGV